MRQTTPLALGFALLTAAPAGAGYRDLRQEIDSYRPSPFYEAHIAPAPAAAQTSPTPSDEDFAAQVKAIQGAREHWEEALKEGVVLEGEAFYPAGLTKAAALEGAQADGVAAAALGDGFDLETLEGLVLLRHPGVKAAQDTLRATLERYSQAANLDEVLRQYTAFTEALMTGVGPMKGREPVPMRFPFPGVLALKGEVVNQDVRAQVEMLELTRRTVVTGARKTYWNLLYVHQAQGIMGEMLALLRRLESVATTRYEAGKTSFQDVIKVRIQLETLEEDLKTLAERQRTLEAKVRELVSLPPQTPVGAPGAREPVLDVPQLDPLYALAGQRRQELRRMRAMVGKMERMIEMAETMTQPGYSLNLSLYADEAVAQVGTFRMREPFGVATTASTGAGLPKMPWYGTNDAYVRETRQKLAALREDLRKAEDATSFGVREAWFGLDQAAREERLYAASVVDLSQAALEVSTRGYETGRVMFADVIASYTNWLKAKLALERRRADLGVGRAELEEAVGASPLN